MMTLNILFFTIKVQLRKPSVDEAIHNEMVEKQMQENKDRYFYRGGMY